MTYYKFKLINGYYWEDTQSDDFYLNELSNHIFDESKGWVQSVKRTLLDPQRHGILGNKSEVHKIDNTIQIMSQFGDNPEEYAIEIDRDVLLKLIDKWQELYDKDSPEIYFIRHEDGTIEVTDHLPEK